MSLTIHIFSDHDGDSPLSLAAVKGHVSAVQVLLDLGCDIDLCNEMGRTALIEAAEQGHECVVRILAEQGANINLQDAEGDTALIVATTKGMVVN